MLKKVILFILPLLIIANSGITVPKVFTVTVKRVIGEHETRDDVRVFATLEAKRQALEQAGTYLQVETIMRDYKLQSDEVTALAAGVLSTEQASEEWGMEGEHFMIWLTYEITIDPENVDQRISDLVADQEKFDDYQRLQESYARILVENEELRGQLEAANAEQLDDLKVKVEQLRDQLSAVDWYNKGIDASDFNNKLEYYSYAIELNPYFVYAYNNRGIVYAELRELYKAISDFNKAINIDHFFSEAFYNRGKAYQLIGDYKLSIADYTWTISIDSNYVAAYNNRGIVYQKLGNYDKAIADYSKAISINPNDDFAYFNRGIIYYIKGDYSQANIDFNKTNKPNDAIEFETRGIAYSYGGDYNSAIAAYSIAISLNPNYDGFYNNRGLAYYNKGDYNRAITDYTKAIEIDPNNALAYYNRGLAYKNNGDKASASRDFIKARILGITQAQLQLEKL